MRLLEFISSINEAVEVRGIQLWAYAAVVAEAYQQAPETQPQAMKAFQLLAKSNDKLYKRLSAKTKVEPTADDPYEGPEDVATDIKKNQQLKVFTGGSDHPAFTPEQNVIFRTVHDYFAHTGPNLKNVGKRFKTHNFTYRGELNAYLVHAKLAPKQAVPVLFTEVVGQASYFLIMNDFPTQKAAILDGFDYFNLGQMSPQRYQRFQQIMQQLQDDNLTHVVLNLPGAQKYPKDKINTELMSTATQTKQPKFEARIFENSVDEEFIRANSETKRLHNEFMKAYQEHRKNPSPETGKAFKAAQNAFHQASNYEQELLNQRYEQRRQDTEDHEYRGQHEAPGPNDAPLHDLTENGIYPDDVYGAEGLRYYANTEGEISALMKARSFRGRPKAPVTVYRAVPKSVGKAKIQPGDWVAITRRYAQEHGRDHLRNDFKIISKNVRARDLYTDGNSIEEWGYHPTSNVAESLLTEMIIRHKAEESTFVIAFQDSIWLTTWDEMFQHEVGGGFSDVSKDIMERTGIDPDTVDLALSEYIKEVRPDIFIASYDEQSNELYIQETGLSHHPSTSKLIKKVAKELGYPKVTMSRIHDGNENEIDYEYPPEEIHGQIPDVLYHGTTDKYLNGIARLGIAPGRADSNWGEQGIIHDNLVFGAAWWHQALFHANRTAKKHGGNPIIIAFKVPDKNRIVPDYDVAMELIGRDHQTDQLGYTRDKQKNFEPSGTLKSIRQKDKNRSTWKDFGFFGYHGRIPPTHLMYIMGLEPHERDDFVGDARAGLEHDNITVYQTAKAYYEALDYGDYDEDEDYDGDGEGRKPLAAGEVDPMSEFLAMESRLDETRGDYYWIDHDGNIIQIPMYDHEEFAEEWLKKQNNFNMKDLKGDPATIYMMDKYGWIRVGVEGMVFEGHWGNPTKKAVRALIKLIGDYPKEETYSFGGLDESFKILDTSRDAIRWLHKEYRGNNA